MSPAGQQWRMKAINLPGVLVAAIMTACGGGGGGDLQNTQAAACVPKMPVRLLMFGDSTFSGTGASQDLNGNLTYAPAPIIQRAMDLQFGAGAVQVLNYSVMGSSSADLVAGIDGVNAPWPTPALGGDIAIINHGINDQLRQTPIAAYRANLAAFTAVGIPVVLQTPNPTFRGWESVAHIQAVRDTAAAAGRTLADVHGYMSGLANAAQYFPDGVHPNDAGYQLIVNNVTLPALVPLVAKLRCQ